MQNNLKNYGNIVLTTGLWLAVLSLLLIIKNTELQPFADASNNLRTGANIHLATFVVIWSLVGAAVIRLPRVLKFLLLAGYVGYLLISCLMPLKINDVQRYTYDQDDYMAYVSPDCEQQLKCMEEVNTGQMQKRIKHWYEKLPEDALAGYSYAEWLQTAQNYCRAETVGRSELDYQKCLSDISYRELIVLANITDIYENK